MILYRLANVHQRYVEYSNMELLFIVVALAALTALTRGRETRDLSVEMPSSSVRMTYIN